MSNLSQPRNPAVMILVVILAVVAIIAIAASVKVSRKNDELAQLRADMDTLRQNSEQQMMQARQIAEDAEKLRQVALKWTLQRQQQLQQEQQRRAASSNAVSAAKSTSSSSTSKPASSTASKSSSSSSKSHAYSSSSRSSGRTPIKTSSPSRH